MVKVPPSSSFMVSLLSRAPAGQLADGLLELGERQAIGVAHDRHDQPLAAADGHADVVVILVDDVGAADLGVDRREGLEGVDGRLHEEGHEAQLDAVLLLKPFLEPLAQ